MKIVIEIDKEDWKDINYIHFIREDLKFKIGKAIMKGKPLPEHHGRIIDESKITKWCYMSMNQLDVGGIRTDAPTIIEGSDTE